MGFLRVLAGHCSRLGSFEMLFLGGVCSPGFRDCCPEDHNTITLLKLTQLIHTSIGRENREQRVVFRVRNDGGSVGRKTGSNIWKKWPLSKQLSFFLPTSWTEKQLWEGLEPLTPLLQTPHYRKARRSRPSCCSQTQLGFSAHGMSLHRAHEKSII